MAQESVVPGKRAEARVELARFVNELLDARTKRLGHAQRFVRTGGQNQ